MNNFRGKLYYKKNCKDFIYLLKVMAVVVGEVFDVVVVRIYFFAYYLLDMIYFVKVEGVLIVVDHSTEIFVDLMHLIIII
jgi:hypothetical protein